MDPTRYGIVGESLTGIELSRAVLQRGVPQSELDLLRRRANDSLSHDTPIVPSARRESHHKRCRVGSTAAAAFAAPGMDLLGEVP